MNQIKVSSVACSGEGGVEASVRRAAVMIEETCLDAPGLICLPEIFAWTSLGKEEKQKAAETVDGNVSRAMSRIAAQHRVNLLVPLLEREGERLFNSMLWLDRQGKAVGIYRKAFPTDYEMAEGVFPGTLDFQVFATEFGPIGCCICFDLNFREVIERLSAQRARLVIFPTMFQGLGLMQAWAKLYRMHFVSVAAQPYSAVVNPLGETMVQPWNHGPILTVTLDLDYVVLHTDQNTPTFPALKKAYGSAIEINSLDIESCALLTSRHPQKTAVEIAAEFGLETECDYYKRSATMAREKRTKGRSSLETN